MQSRRFPPEPDTPAAWRASGALGRPGVVPTSPARHTSSPPAPRPRLRARTYGERRRLSGAGPPARTRGVREEDAASACMDGDMNHAAVPTRSLDTGHARYPLPEPTRLLSVGDVCRTLQCGRTFVYELLQKGELRAIKVGRLTRISPAGLDDFIARQERSSVEVPTPTVDRGLIGRPRSRPGRPRSIRTGGGRARRAVK